MTKTRSFKFASFVKKYLHLKYTRLSNAIKILTSSLMKRDNTFLLIKLILISTSKTLLTLWRKSTEFLGKRCIGRLLRFLTMRIAQNAIKISSFQSCSIAYSTKKRIWNSLERTSNFTNVARKMKNDSLWFLKSQDVLLKCINFKKQRNWNK